MGCCGKGGSTTKYVVTFPDGTSKTYLTEYEATQAASRSSGATVRTVTS